MLGIEPKIGGLGHHSRCIMSKLLPSRLVPWLAAMVPIGLSACNQYEMFLVTGDEQVAFSGKVDVLFVVDNSGSMSDEASLVQEQMNSFVSTISGAGLDLGLEPRSPPTPSPRQKNTITHPAFTSSQPPLPAAGTAKSAATLRAVSRAKSSTKCSQASNSFRRA